MAAEQSKQSTGDIPSSGGSNEHSLESNTLIVVLGASGDLAKKKVSSTWNLPEPDSGGWQSVASLTSDDDPLGPPRDAEPFPALCSVPER